MQILTVISGKGGVGKTTLTANVAIALAQRGKRVLAIDLDPQNALGVHLGMDASESAGLARDGLSDNVLFQSPFGVSFIPFGLLQNEELREFEADLRNHKSWLRQGIFALSSLAFDFVLIDTPPGPGVFLHQALQAANRALVVVLADAASFATVQGILALVDEYTVERCGFEGVNLLMNQLSHHSALSHQVRNYMMASYGNLMLPVFVHRDPMVSESLAYERPVLQYAPGCEASIEIHHIADWLLSNKAA